LIRKWLAKRPRWHVHLTPTGSSWLNPFERFFALITERKIRRGIYRSVAALRAEITSFIEHHNADPRPFRWTKSADDILRSIERLCATRIPAVMSRDCRSQCRPLEAFKTPGRVNRMRPTKPAKKFAVGATAIRQIVGMR
jgi:hypothetical protein